MPVTFRNTVRVMAETKRNEVQHFATNPHTCWGWYADGGRNGTGFKRADGAKADAARVLGPVTWKRTHGGAVIEGKYGPEMTPEEFLNQRAPNR